MSAYDNRRQVSRDSSFCQPGRNRLHLADIVFFLARPMRKVDTISAVDLDIDQSWCQDLALEINRGSCSKCFFPDRRILARIRYEAIDRAWIVQNHARDSSQKPIYPEGCGAGRQVAAVRFDEVTVGEPDQSAVNMEVIVVDHIGFLELYQDLRNEPKPSGGIGGIGGIVVNRMHLYVIQTAGKHIRLR
jgi:hypothetical protein